METSLDRPWRFRGDMAGLLVRRFPKALKCLASDGFRFPASFAMFPLVPASFGDIVAAAGIARSIYKTLSHSTGSSYEYQCLIAEVHSFEQALRTIHGAISVTTLSARDTQDIEAETTRCFELLKKFLESIKSYQKALGGSGKGANSWRKIGWGLFKAGEVASFRQKLSQHKQNITVFLNGFTV